MTELKPWVRAAVAITLCLLVAWWARVSSVAALRHFLFVLPTALMGVSFASLHWGPVFIDLSAAASYVLLMLAIFRTWDNLRHTWWTDLPEPDGQPLALWAWWRGQRWSDRVVGHLMDVLQQHAPNTRLVFQNAQPIWLGRARWPEFANFLALVGPAGELERARPELEAALKELQATAAEPVALPAGATRDGVVQCCLGMWTQIGPAPKVVAGAAA
jgi:hypothetical protein